MCLFRILKRWPTRKMAVFRQDAFYTNGTNVAKVIKVVDTWLDSLMTS